MRSLLALTLLALSLLAAPIASAGGIAVPTEPTLTQAINGSWRTPAFVRRDQYRHPRQVLEFFGLKPDLTVIELAPGGGWWTEILAPYLKTRGQLIETTPPESATGFMGKMRDAFMKKLHASPELYSNVKTVPFAPPKKIDLGPAGSADMVLTFRNLHDWENEGVLGSVLQAAYAVLKPGGVFGIVEHRALPYAEAKQSAKKLHRLPEDFVIDLMLRTGFRLAAVSDLNANPKDPLTVNVHHLPPDLSHDSSAQKRRYEAIGESDRMTLRFVKPAR